MRLHLRSLDDLEEILDRFTPLRTDHDLDHPLRPRAPPRAAARAEFLSPTRPAG